MKFSKWKKNLFFLKKTKFSHQNFNFFSQFLRFFNPEDLSIFFLHSNSLLPCFLPLDTELSNYKNSACNLF